MDHFDTQFRRERIEPGGTAGPLEHNKGMRRLKRISVLDII